MNALGAPKWNPEELGSKKREREREREKKITNLPIILWFPL